MLEDEGLYAHLSRLTGAEQEVEVNFILTMSLSSEEVQPIFPECRLGRNHIVAQQAICWSNAPVVPACRNQRPYVLPVHIVRTLSAEAAPPPRKSFS